MTLALWLADDSWRPLLQDDAAARALAWAALFEVLGPTWRRLARRTSRRSRGALDAEDVLQSIRVKCEHVKQRLIERQVRHRRDGRSPRDYFLVVARNCCRDLLSQDRRRPAVAGCPDPLAHVAAAAPARDSDGGRAARLSACLGWLEEKDRLIVLRHVQGGEPFAVIAADLGMTAVAVRQRYHRAIERLKGWVEEGDERGR